MQEIKRDAEHVHKTRLMHVIGLSTFSKNQTSKIQHVIRGFHLFTCRLNQVNT